MISRQHPARILVATSNRGKLRDFAVLARMHGFEVDPLPRFSEIPLVVETEETFEDNARKKAAEYSRHAPGELVIADDSGLAVDALHGSPGVRSARYALDAQPAMAVEARSIDEANNARLLHELQGARGERRRARFISVIALARDSRVLQTFSGTLEGHIGGSPRGYRGFGYDPLFLLEDGRTVAELSDREKAAISHRALAFEKLLLWLKSQPALRGRTGGPSSASFI